MVGFILAGIIICIFHWFGCFNYIFLFHLLALFIAIGVLIWIASFFVGNRSSKSTSPSVGITLIIATLAILLGIVIYPSLKDRLSKVTICQYCELQFFKNFQNESKGLCKCMDGTLDFNTICIFPRHWDIRSNYTNFQKDFLNNHDRDLLALVCAPNCNELLKKFNAIKEEKLRDLSKTLKSDKEIETISQLFLIDQLLLQAACETISQCQSSDACATCENQRKSTSFVNSNPKPPYTGH